MSTDGSDKPKQPSMGIASCIVAGVMLLIQVGVILATAANLHDNQGIIYAFSVPFVTYLIGVPLGLLLALAGLLQRAQKHTASLVGFLLTLAGPVVFLVSVAVLGRW